MQPLVTIIMPAYNSSSYISASINSVLHQSFLDFELLVINDCSTDRTSDIVTQYCVHDSRIRLINLVKNMGTPAGPRNIGIAQARGKWVAFLDSDDIWHTNKLQRQLELLNKTGALFCSTKMIDFTDESDLILEDTLSNEYEIITFTKQLIKNRTPTSSVIVAKDLIRRNLFNEDIRFKAREDLDCWLHCHEEAGYSIKINAPMLGYRIVSSQISGNKWQMLRRHLYVLQEYRFLSGHKMTWMAFIFTFTHFLLSIYNRKIKKTM